MASETAPRSDMASRYDPIEAERRWYDWWEAAGYFRPDPTSDAPTFVITIPPPNVTGDLHIGHALTYGIEDVVGRFKRMQGFNTLILPGMDHAGIATQNVVERNLSREGTSRHEIGREAFVERAWEWKELSAENIRRQFRTLGYAFDWSRERFTLDAGYVDAVQEFFIHLFNEGKIYRGWRVINWCGRCQSAISDIEVEDVARSDTLYYLRYPLKDGSGDITVATVRPETILGDVAVAVHPQDPRYRRFIGKSAVLPLIGRELPIIADEMVDREFGTGAVKITPAHDFADFEAGERHGLAMPIAFDTSGEITDVGGPYRGQSVAEARENVIRDLQAGHYILKAEAYDHRVPTCERCGTVLEPLLSEQWFMHMTELAAPAMQVVRDGAVSFIPSRWSRVYLDWMENIRPWTLSRQLWWGHRIPIYYCANGHSVASKSWPDLCPTCGGEILRQDSDVLDTWFSSALWPFAVLGWPQDTDDLRRFYPTSFMNTSSQILYLWIARMIMSGLKLMDDIPYPTVLINPTILTKDGQRMSKSLGTGVDPLELVQEYGADALRFGLMTLGSTHQQDIRFSAERFAEMRNFGNKVWNVARAVMRYQTEDESDGELSLSTADRWILSRLATVTQEVTNDLERFELSGAGQRLYDFVWSEFADWYLEVAKIRLFQDASPDGRFTARAVLWSVLDRVTRLLHPYMPFLSEEIWQHLRQCGSLAARRLSGWEADLPDSVMIAPWPASGTQDAGAELEMNQVMSVVRAVRAARAEYRATPGAWISASIAAGADHAALQGSFDIISELGRLRPLAVYDHLTEKPSDTVTLLVGDATVYIPMSELTDVEAERDRLRKERDAAQKALSGADHKLKDERFISRAPAEVVDRERERAIALTEKIRRIQERLEHLET